MAELRAKQDFLSNLNGTTLFEISLGLPLAPLCLLSRGLLLTLYTLRFKKPFRSETGLFVLDFAVLVVPPVLSCTVLSPVLPWVMLSVAAFCAGSVFAVYKGRTKYVRVPLPRILGDFSRTGLAGGHVPSVTAFRVFVNVLTSVGILAVDFPQYPRRYAKTETYGTGVMDFGVGSFVFGNAVVCPEVRRGAAAGSRGRLFDPAKQLWSVWPLVALGVGRLVSLKAVGYHEHVSEYGVHWNFFFTLAAVRVAASLLLAAVSPRRAWAVALALAAGYECLLGGLSLKDFVLHGSDGRGSRDGFLDANREGIFSSVGYLAIYMASAQIGLYLARRRSTVGEWLSVARAFLAAVGLLFLGLHVTRTCVDAVSRRLANLPFCIWMVAHGLALFLCFLAADLALVFVKRLVDGAHVPGSWEFAEPAGEKRGSDASSGRKGAPEPGGIVGAVNKNQLLYFVLANVFTGLVNMAVDTIHSSTLSAMFILHLYMFANCWIVHMLQATNITLKWW